jgi:hypothetical protein
MFRIPWVLGLAAFATASLADEPSALVASAFGNTIVATYPDGGTAQLWLQPGGGYTAEGRAHDRSVGHWRVRDGKLCFRQAHPFAFGYVYCTRLSRFATGSVWVIKAVTGEALQVRLVSGRPGSSEGGVD